jgi:hypothetical protein
VEGAQVEFEIEKEESGKLKAVNVTNPGGGSIKPPSRERKRPPRKENQDGNANAESGDESKDEAITDEEGPKDSKGGRKPRRRAPAKVTKKPVGEETEAPKKEREPPFHDVINDAEKEKIAAKGIDLGQKMTIDVALGDSRIKLGQGGYAGLAHASGMVGEGTYKCSDKGLVSFNWERSLEFIDGKWTPGTTSKLMQKLSLTEGTFSHSCAPVIQSCAVEKFEKLQSSGSHVSLMYCRQYF